MNLLQLPTEILLLILRLLGPGFFHHDTRRLMVSKWWYELARLVLLRDLQFSAKSLPRFLRTDMSSLVHQHTRTVDIAFDGVQDRSAVLSASPDVRERMVSDWTTNVANDLTSLAAILQDCRNLRSLKLKPRPKWRARSVFLRTYFSSDALVPLLSCAAPHASTIAVSNEKICPRILKPPGEGTISSLEEVIINLNLGDLPSMPCLSTLTGAESSYPAYLQRGKQTWS
ncbi:hypothetical protein MRS44_010978 [Fusarium solani]|uniref:uncharacterized protein n=1 Tax=Fusarium solani TaxID=169388 RepID=UPI0032C3E9FB|nr:hypothetical protein MRS44_010978 [Fusarium solani]